MWRMCARKGRLGSSAEGLPRVYGVDGGGIVGRCGGLVLRDGVARLCGWMQGRCGVGAEGLCRWSSVRFTSGYAFL